LAISVIANAYKQKTNEVQSLDTPHLPKYMRKLMQSYDFYLNMQILFHLFSS